MTELETNTFQFDIEESASSYHVSKISTILNYELSTSALFLLSFLSGIFLMLASLTAVLFITYLTYVLWIERKYFWLTSLYLLIVLPFLIISIFLSNFFLYSFFLIVGIFYFYCFALRYAVNEWIRKKNWKRQLLIEKLQTENNGDLFNS